jgi:hypothetical protein
MQCRPLRVVASVILAAGTTTTSHSADIIVPQSTLFDSTGGEMLKRPADFARIEDRRDRSIALFLEASKVITSPRCINCHPATDRPTQTDAERPHQPWVVRGADGMGAPGLRCTTCHQRENFPASGVPGNQKWRLAPASMAWQGKTVSQICEQIIDPQRNGKRDEAALIRHMADDSLVGWAWRPGAQRKAAPGTQAGFGALIRAWFAAGGSCPQPSSALTIVPTCSAHLTDCWSPAPENAYQGGRSNASPAGG